MIQLTANMVARFYYFYSAKIKIIAESLPIFKTKKQISRHTSSFFHQKRAAKLPKQIPM